MEGFSKYFTFEELTNSANHPNLVVENRKDAMQFLEAGKRNSILLEDIKFIALDGDIVDVSNGHRCDSLNKAVGGVDRIINGVKKLSKHRIFEATDSVPRKHTVKDAFKKIMDAHKAGKLPNLRKCIIEEVHGKIWLHTEAMQPNDKFLGFWETTDAKNYTRVA